MQITPSWLIAIVLSSSLLAALLSAFANHLLAAKQYERDYYHHIILRRLEAYELVHNVIGIFRGVSYDNDGRTAHLPFTGGKELLIQAQSDVAVAIGRSIWLEPEVRDQLVSLNRLMLKVPSDGTKEVLFAAGATIYIEVGSVRENLEATVTRNLQDLHDVRRFLRRKERHAQSDVAPRIEMVPRIR